MPPWQYRLIMWLADREVVVRTLVQPFTWVIGYALAGWRGLIVAVAAELIGAFLMMLHDIRETNL